MARRKDHFLLRGGLDLVTPTLTVPNGHLLSVRNYEPVEGGYERLAGYERFDGRPAPSAAAYSVLGFDGASSVALVGDTITGATSGATALLIADAVINSGSLAGGDAAGSYVIAEISGVFEDDETLQVSGADKGIANGIPRLEAADDIEIYESYLSAAADNRRSSIEAVPGAGPVRGVWGYNGTLYAFRDNAGATACVMHKATDAGWAVVALGDQIAFDAGGEEPAVGDTITGETSTATATLVAVLLDSGSWPGDDAAGTFFLTDVNGDFQDNENLQATISGSATTVAVANGVVSDRALAPGGRYEFRNHNFLGQADGRRMYGVDGKNPAFEWDGQDFMPIVTGLPANLEKPKHLAIQSSHLLLSYAGGSIQNSGTGKPLSWTAVDGAAEIATGQEVFGMIEGVGLGNTLILGANTVQALYGQDKDSWELRTHTGEESGTVEWTGQMMGVPVYMDNRGIRSVETTERYGNFLTGTVSYLVQPWIERQRAHGNSPTASMRVRAKDMYRLFFETRIGLSIYFGRARPECSLIELGHNVRCTCSFEAANGVERVFFGSDDGWVFEMERGRSFDGAAIDSFARVAFNHLGAPAGEARFFKADIQVETPERAALKCGAEFDYGAGDAASMIDVDPVRGGGALWEEAIWDEFYWDSPLKSIAEFRFSGIGRNISMLVQSETNGEQSHILSGMTIHYAPRRLRR